MKIAFSMFIVFFALPVIGKTEWANRELNFEASPTATETHAKFPFTNSSDQPVIITDIKSSCGCTTAKLDQKTYQPGESGAIAVYFEFGDRLGPQIKTIAVTSEQPGSTDAEGKPVKTTTTLTLRVNIPEILRPQPTFLSWRPGEPRTEKYVDLRIMWPEPVKIKSVTTEGDSVKTRVEYLKNDRRYRLYVTPSPGDTEAKTKLTITTDFPPESPRTYTLYARAMGAKKK